MQVIQNIKKAIFLIGFLSQQALPLAAFLFSELNHLQDPQIDEGYDPAPHRGGQRDRSTNVIIDWLLIQMEICCFGQ